MSNYDEKTPRGWPLPYNSNTLEFDVERLRRTLFLIDEALGEIEHEAKEIVDEKLASVEERQYILDARMDVIAGQTTEDSEVLDARVDAEGTTHPNLGHNVRNLHSRVIELNETVIHWLNEFSGMLRQFNDLAYAQIQGELNSLSAHERRKEEIQQTNERIDEEARERLDVDAQIREEISQEALTRDENDGILQEQVQELSEASIQDSVNLSREAEQRRKVADDLKTEIETRKNLAREVGEGFAEVKEAVRHEETKRVKVFSDLQAETQSEIQTLKSHDETLQTEADANAEANMYNALRIHEEAEKRREGLHDVNEALNTETQTREESDRELHRELSAVDDRLSTETQTREETDTEIQHRLDGEEYARRSDDVAQQLQIEANAEAGIRNALNIHDEAEHRREEISDVRSFIKAESEQLNTALESEEAERISADGVLQSEADVLANASLQHSLNLHEEAEHRREAVKEVKEALASEAQTREEHDENLRLRISAVNDEISREKSSRASVDSELHRRLDDEEYARRSDDTAQQLQINETAEAVIRNTLNLEEVNERRKTELAREEAARISADMELQQEADVLASASIQHSLNLHEEAEHRREAVKEVKEALASEAQTREEHDENLRLRLSAVDKELSSEKKSRIEADSELHKRLNDEEFVRRSDDIAQQLQIDANAEAGIRNTLNIHEEAEHRRRVNDALNTEIQQRTEQSAQQNEEISRNARDIEAETQARADGDLSLARQADANAESNIRNTLNIHDVNERRKADLIREEQSRIAGDENLQGQINRTAEVGISNALNIHQEAEQRRKLNERIEVLEDESDRHNEVDDYHQQQIDAAILSILQNILTLNETLSRRREAIHREEQSRFEEDSAIQAQTNTNAETAMRNALNIHEEADKRRELSARLIEEKHNREHQIQDLRAEIGTLYEIPLPGLYESLSGLQEQSDKNAETGMLNALNLHEEAERRRGVGGKIEAVSTYLQHQIDSIIHAILEDAVNLHDEVIRRKASENDERQSRFNEDTALQTQVNTAVQGILQNTLNLSEALSRQREALKQEADARANEDTFLQSQANTNAITGMELALALSDEAGKRRILERAADRSKYTSLAISEPRCAVVNISGINAMPTSKTVELNAVMEFWDMQGNYFRKNITCAAQGNSSMGYVKKNVKFDLLNNDGSEFELKIGDWVAQDGFHLKAYYTDFFRGVAVASYQFWDEVMTHNAERPHVKALYADGVKDLTLQLDTGALCHPDGFPCLVYLNGEFYGIFAWQIKKQRKNYRMDKSTVEHIHIDGTLYTQYFWNGVINWTVFEIRNPNKLYTMDGKKYDGDAPRELIDETSEKYDPDNKDHKRTVKVKKYIQALVQNFSELKTLYTAYTRNRTDENLAAVKAKYEEIFDWENQRDYLIFSDIIKNSDGFGKNWQWTTYDGVKWYVNAYDLDMSFGGHWQGTQITPPLTAHITTSTAIPTGFIVQLYCEELNARYKELRDVGIISVSNIFRKLQDWVSRIGEGYYEREYERWPSSPCILNYTDSLARVKSWLETEIANMDRIYNYSPDDSAIKTALALEALTRENSDETECIIRTEQDAGILAQVNQLAIANMWLAVREYETHQKVKEIEIKAESIPTRAATDEEFDEMLDELYNKP